MDASSDFCRSCSSRVVPPLPFEMAQPAAQPAYQAPPYGQPSGSFFPPGAFRPHGPRRQGTLRIVVLTAAVTLAICTAIAGSFLSRAASASEEAKSSVEHMTKTFDNTQAVSAIESVIRTDTGLLQLLDSASHQLTGSADDRMDRKAQLIRDYVRIAGDADTSHCPASVVEEYKRHLSLWSDLAQAYAGHPHVPSEEESFVIRFLQNIAGDSGSDTMAQQEIAEWTRHLQDASNRADQGTQEFLNSSKAAIDSVGKDADAAK